MNHCKFCGEQAEIATTIDDSPAASDCCYGCRNRYLDAQNALTDAINAVAKAQRLLEQCDGDTTGITLGDVTGRNYSELHALAGMVREARI